MSAREVMEPDALAREVQSMSGWTVVDGKLRKEYTFADFATAFAFMAGAALRAERKNHHPEWSNVYNRVVVELNTHDVGGITGWDVELAKEFDEIAGTVRG